MHSFQSPFYLAAIILAALAIILSNARATEIVTNKIGGITFSVAREYVFSWRVEKKGRPLQENFGVAFSIPSHEPFGTQRDADGKLISDAERRQKTRARGEEILDVMIEPDRGRLAQYQKSRSEQLCRRIGQELKPTEHDGVAGYECLIDASVGVVGRRIFPIAISSGEAVLVCKFMSTGTPPETCEAVVGGRDDKISLTLLSLKREDLLKIPALIDAADQFIAQKMTRVPPR